LHIITKNFALTPQHEQRVPSPANTHRSGSPGLDSAFLESDSESELESADMEMASPSEEARTPKRPTSSGSRPTPRKQKQCACCGCTSTPLWRDMGKNQPLCNACGIRWKKYGVVCDVCSYVPCKQERERKYCKRCSSVLPAAPKRMRAASPQTVPKKFPTVNLVY